MAEASIVVDVHPNCGLEIKTTRDDEGMGQRRMAAKRCRIVGPKELLQCMPTKSNGIEEEREKDDDLITWISPVADIPLPPISRRVAGMPEEATRYAFVYPSAKLAKKLSNGNNNKSGYNQNGNGDVVGNESWRQALMVGSFAFFDDNEKLLQVNAISLFPTGYDMLFSGPLPPTEPAVQSLTKFNRMQSVTVASWSEVGFVALGWFHAGETFRDQDGKGKGICLSTPNRFGGFIYSTDHGIHAVYLLDPQQTLLSTTTTTTTTASDESSIKKHATPPRASPDFSNESGALHILVQNFITEHPNGRFLSHKEEIVTMIKDLRELLLTYAMDDIAAEEDVRLEMAKTITEKYEGSHLIFHKACQLRAPPPMIGLLMSLAKDLRSSLLFPDQMGWLPLHYACRYEPSYDVVYLLLQEQPDAVMVREEYGRYPLHLACDSGASGTVIKCLLEADSENKAVFEPSKFLGWLPIHYECAHRADLGVIRALLQQDPDGKTVLTRTEDGLLPLHLALRNRADPLVVHKLLKHDPTGGRQSASERFNDVRGRITMSMLPIHMACLKQAPVVVIDNLLAMGGNNTVYEKAYRVNDDKRSLDGSSLSSVNTRAGVVVDDMLPLHVACNTPSPPSVNVVTSLLHADKTRGTVKEKDILERLPLHIALMRHASVVVVQDLLYFHKEDQIRQTNAVGRYPLHEACSFGTTGDVAQLLLETDESTATIKEEPSIEKKDNRERRAIYYALRRHADDAVLVELLRGDRFMVRGLDSTSLEELARRISGCKELQEIVSEKSSARTVVAWLLGEIYLNAVLVYIYIRATEDTLNGNTSMTEIIILVVSALYLLFREVLQFERLAYYLGDPWNYIDLAKAALILTTAIELWLSLEDDRTVSRQLFLTTGTLVVIGSILFLRSTFLPFARFVGGLIEIFSSLVTFLMVSALVLLVFAYAFYVDEHEDENGNPITSIGDGYLFTLTSFFGGPGSTQDIVDVVFGVFVVIILLNVLIAIVSDAWDDSGERVGGIFFYFRLSFLSQEDTVIGSMRRVSKRRFKMEEGRTVIAKIFHLIDSLPDLLLRDTARWSEPPFDQVTRYEQYREPERFFTKEEAEQIKSIQSWEGSIMWVNLESKSKQETTLMNLVVTLEWVSIALVYLLLVILGIPTLGITWPRSFRKAIMGNNWIGEEQEEEEQEEDNNEDDRLGQLEEKVEELLEKTKANTKTQERLSRIESKLDALISPSEGDSDKSDDEGKDSLKQLETQVESVLLALRAMKKDKDED